jgi:phosphoglycolate phosphatase-like HAD superfamily hydrolase
MAELSSGADAARDLLRRAQLVFWDFDGVIKDSVAVKTEAFERLFSGYGVEVVRKVREHHEANGGVSRFKKMPLYLSWAGEAPDAEHVRLFCERFSQAVFQAVIDAPWVPGVREYIDAHHESQPFVLLTATPQNEIDSILAALCLRHCFREVHGAPTAKSVAIEGVLKRCQQPAAAALMVGDADADLAAAEANAVPFLLRRTPLNLSLQQTFSGVMFDHLS